MSADGSEVPARIRPPPPGAQLTPQMPMWLLLGFE